MEKIQFKAIYGIAVEKSSCSAYVLQQKLIKKLRSQIDLLKSYHENSWKDVWGRIEDRVLSMEDDEIRSSWEMCQSKNILEFQEEMQKIVNRNRYGTYKIYK
jgi:hypothetical protein